MAHKKCNKFPASQYCVSVYIVWPLAYGKSKPVGFTKKKEEKTKPDISTALGAPLKMFMFQKCFPIKLFLFFSEKNGIIYHQVVVLLIFIGMSWTKFLAHVFLAKTVSHIFGLTTQEKGVVIHLFIFCQIYKYSRQIGFNSHVSS